MSEEKEVLERLYERFNARDMESVLAAIHEDVEWANGWEGGYVYGREGVREYWTRQWAMIDPHVEPVSFSTGPEGEIIVGVHQIVHDLKGNLLADTTVEHIFRFEAGFVKRFDIHDNEPGPRMDTNGRE
jgi:hypothetical protein